MRETAMREPGVADPGRHELDDTKAGSRFRRNQADSAWRRRSGHAGPKRCLLELDPDLAEGLGAERLEHAAGTVRVPVVTVPRGPWPIGDRRPSSAGHLGLLVLEGVAVRELALENIVSSELVGPGELFVPWMDHADDAVLGEQVRWQALTQLRVAVVDRTAVTALAPFPEVMCALFERLALHRARGARLRAIGQLNSVDRRVLALLRHVAERWGRVTPAGTVIPLTLSHRLLAELVGARRPTVSTAVARLAAAGEVSRREDGTWLLPGGLPAEAPREPKPVVLHRRRLFVQQAGIPTAG